MLLQHPLRTSRTLDEITPAIGALTAQPSSGAIRTERALVCADQGIGRTVGQVLVAAFAVGTEVEHGFVLRRAGDEVKSAKNDVI
jgi:hypothetical protein